MLTYQLKKAPGVPLYEALYRCIRADILSGVLVPGQKLPSKRALAANLEVSKITVEAAYDQLVAEGYICAKEKVGYFVEAVEHRTQARQLPEMQQEEKPLCAIDLTQNACMDFPFSVWSSLQRSVMREHKEKLLQSVENQGLWSLRSAIAAHLQDFRGMHVSPENILVGAGTDFLYNLLIQLLGRDLVYAVEEPGYNKIRKIYDAGGVQCISAPLDSRGVIPEALDRAQVLHLSPAHHFPTGIITPMPRRADLLQWAQAQTGRYIIEDDYDSEFRFNAHPMPTLFSMDRAGRVIYMNTFSKTLAPSIRISYMVLPDPLMAHFRQKLGFYSCTVPSFEQYTLERFLREGHFEKHINRMRKAYNTRRNRVLEVLRGCPFGEKLTVLEQDAGLHFLLLVKTDLSDESLVARCLQNGIRVRSLSSYYHDNKQDRHCLVVNYSGVSDEKLQLLEQTLHAMQQEAT